MTEYRHSLLHKLQNSQLPSNQRWSSHATIKSDRSNWQSHCHPDHETNKERAQRSTGSAHAETSQDLSIVLPANVTVTSGGFTRVHTSGASCRYECSHQWIRCTVPQSGSGRFRLPASLLVLRLRTSRKDSQGTVSTLAVPHRFFAVAVSMSPWPWSLPRHRTNITFH